MPSTVKTIRLRHGQLRSRSQSHPRRVDGFLTVPQLARMLGITPHWIYDRIYNGSIPAAKDPATGLCLFRDDPATLDRLRALLIGNDTRPGA